MFCTMKHLFDRVASLGSRLLHGAEPSDWRSRISGLNSALVFVSHFRCSSMDHCGWVRCIQPPVGSHNVSILISHCRCADATSLCDCNPCNSLRMWRSCYTNVEHRACILAAGNIEGSDPLYGESSTMPNFVLSFGKFAYRSCPLLRASDLTLVDPKIDIILGEQCPSMQHWLRQGEMEVLISTVKAPLTNYGGAIKLIYLLSEPVSSACPLCSKRDANLGWMIVSRTSWLTWSAPKFLSNVTTCCSICPPLLIFTGYYRDLVITVHVNFPMKRNLDFCTWSCLTGMLYNHWN